MSSCTTKGQDKVIENQEDTKPMYQNIRKPAAAGQFYPEEREKLTTMIKGYLESVPEQDIVGFVKAIMVPHAGYVFSGPVAAYSYNLLKDEKIDTAVIICNSHTSYFEGVAIDDSDAWETPLGLVEVNKDLAEKITDSDDSINFNSKAHIADHTLEVQLPFLQYLFKEKIRIVPILFGNTKNNDYIRLAKALNNNLSDNDIVIVSTDMSHYPSYDDAYKIDQETLEKIKTGNINELEQYISQVESENVPGEDTLICGIDGVKTVMELSKLDNWDEAKILEYANSGDEYMKDKSRVVGYGALAFLTKFEKDVALTSGSSRPLRQAQGSQDDSVLNKEQKKRLLEIAKETVETFVKTGKKLDVVEEDERLNWKEGAFVTIHHKGALRGCIGQIIPTEKPLYLVVRDMAISACSEDYRFNPVKEKELEDIEYEISVLSVPEVIDDWKKIEMGKHGVIVRKGHAGGVFLPQVAGNFNNDKEAFLAELCAQKAGLPRDCYKNDPDVTLEIYTAQVFDENDI
jgi:AmmeMemoRadiSam system protein B/AmmeMemoRadiSam system protein A